MVWLQLQTHLCVQGLLDANPALDACLSSLNLGHDPLYVLQLVASLPEHTAVVMDLVGGLALHLTGDRLNVVSAKLLISFDKLLEISLAPVGEALGGEWLMSVNSWLRVSQFIHFKHIFCVISFDRKF